MFPLVRNVRQCDKESFFDKKELYKGWGRGYNKARTKRIQSQNTKISVYFLYIMDNM